MTNLPVGFYIRIRQMLLEFRPYVCLHIQISHLFCLSPTYYETSGVNTTVNVKGKKEVNVVYLFVDFSKKYLKSFFSSVARKFKLKGFQYP